jgi:signal transduction histidine kinase
MKISSQIILGFTFTLFIIILITIIFYIEKNKYESTSKWLIHTSEVLKSSAQLQKVTVDLETAFRGYLLSGQKEFLRPYYRDGRIFPKAYKNTFDLVADNPPQQQTLKIIEGMVDDWEKNFAQPLIDAKERSTFSEAERITYEKILREKVRSGLIKIKMDSISIEFEKFDNRELALQKERSAKLDESLINVNRMFIGLMGVSIVFVLFLTLFISRSISARIKELVNLSEDLAEGKFSIAKIKETNDELRPLSESLKLTAVKLNEAFSRITVSNKELDQFAYVVSHDLKAPLRAIASLSSWIEEDMGARVTPEISSHIATLKSRIVRMEGLINGLLEYSRIGKIKLENEKVDTYQLVKDIVSDLQIGSQIEVNIQKDMPSVLTPKLRLKQVFQNLIDNAVKYGRSADPRIDITWKDYPGFFEFSITDNGPGIDPEYHDKIFVIFQTLEARDKIESTGIGLSIVKKIVEENRGSIRVESQPGKGTRFIFSWPKNSL